MYLRLQEQMDEFQKALEPTNEIGVQLVQSGTATLIHIESVGFHGPDLVTFEGIEPGGGRVTIVKHFTQVDIALKALPALNDPPRRIGFVTE